jgi:hypothetical protein
MQSVEQIGDDLLDVLGMSCGEVRQPHAITVATDVLVRDPECQPRLPYTAWANKRDKSVLSDQFEDLHHCGRSADQRTSDEWQVVVLSDPRPRRREIQPKPTA